MEEISNYCLGLRGSRDGIEWGRLLVGKGKRKRLQIRKDIFKVNYDWFGRAAKTGNFIQMRAGRSQREGKRRLGEAPHVLRGRSRSARDELEEVLWATNAQKGRGNWISAS